MSEFLIRTEELSDDLIKEWYVETEDNCKIINALKARTPVLLVGSRGMGNYQKGIHNNLIYRICLIY